MSFAQRAKTFRSAQGKPIKNQVYKLQALCPPPVYTSGIAASAEYVATSYGSSKGSVVLLPTDASKYKPVAQPFTVNAHAIELGDLAWAPFTQGQLATCAADGSVKIWSVPEGGLTANLITPAAKFDGYDAVHTLAYHPSASGILAAGHKNGLSVFDLEAQAEKYVFKLDGFGKDVCSAYWNRTGSLLSSVSKNCSLNVMDPRSADASILNTSTATPSTLIKKLQHGMFIGGEGTNQTEYLLLFGVAASQRPVMMWVDPRNPTAAVKTHDFEFSQGFALPTYEPDTNMMYYTVRGSETFALLDLEMDKPNTPQIWPSSMFSTTSAVKGYCLLPKKACTTGACEIERIFTLGGDAIDAYSITVPRKTIGFHAELFPDTASDKSAQTGAEWAAGTNKAPLKMSMVAIHESGGSANSSQAAAAAAGLVTQTSRLAVSTAASSSSSSSGSSSTPSSSKPAASPSAASSSSSSSAAATYVPSSTRTNIDAKLKKSAFTHCTGKEPASNFQSYFDMKLGATMTLSENIQANRTYFAVPWRASGGSAIAVFRLAQDALGRCPPTQYCIRGHKSQATTFDFSPFRQDQFASGSYEGQIFLWTIPQGGLKADLNDPTSILSTNGKVNLVKYHPYVADVLLSLSSSFDGHFIEVWNTSKAGNQSEPTLSLNLHPEPIIDLSVHPRSHLLATTCRDGKTRIINIANQAVVSEFAPPEGVKDTRPIWVANERLLTVGFGAGGQRSMSLFNTSTSTPTLLQTVEFDRVNYLPLPRYDPDTRLLYVANSGGTFIPLYQVNDTSIELLNSSFQSGVDATGFIILSKHLCNIKQVELQRALKLTKDSVLPIIYQVPRKRLEFFQDDLYPPTRSLESEMSVEDFFSGKYKNGKEPTLVSLKPADMELLSQAPDEEATERERKYQAKLAADKAEKPVGALGHTDAEGVKQHFLALQKCVEGGNRFDARVDNSKIDVDESEWD